MRDFIRYYADAPRLGSFLIFLVLGVLILRRTSAAARRRRVNLFLAYVVALSLAVVFVQYDDWPFSPYPLMRGTWNVNWRYDKITTVGVDDRGKEWELDPMTWSPVFPLVLQEWFNITFPRLSKTERTEAVAFLLEKAESARQRRAAGRAIGNERFLGSLTASDWWLYRRIETNSPRPFVAIRVYRDMWKPAELVRDPTRFQRHLIMQYAAAR